jgi:hypothetical protein
MHQSALLAPSFRSSPHRGERGKCIPRARTTALYSRISRISEAALTNTRELAALTNTRELRTAFRPRRSQHNHSVSLSVSPSCTDHARQRKAENPYVQHHAGIFHVVKIVVDHVMERCVVFAIFDLPPACDACRDR